MSFIILLRAVDPYLGRVEYTSLSDQTLMEMIIEGFDEESKRKYQDKHGMYLDVCEWDGIKCYEDESVAEIKTDGFEATGSLLLCYIPPKVKRCSISLAKLTGSIDLT